MNWSKVCRPVKNGGLGIRSLRRVIGSLGQSMGMSGVVGARNLCRGLMVFVCGSALEVAG